MYLKVLDPHVYVCLSVCVFGSLYVFLRRRGGYLRQWLRLEAEFHSLSLLAHTHTDNSLAQCSPSYRIIFMLLIRKLATQSSGKHVLDAQSRLEEY